MPSKKQKYRWLQSRFWLWLIIYWLTCMIGAGMIERGGGKENLEGGFIILSMLVFIVVCMINERGQWKLWKRIGFIFVAWIGQAILIIPFSFFFILITSEYQVRATSFFASLPFVIFSMRRSKLFVISIVITTL